MKNTLLALALLAGVPAFSQQNANIEIYPEKGNQIIPKEIYGQFAEHLGTCIYGGLWVGEDSSIPNVDGYRTDVLEAGIGPKENRPRMVNNNWGGTVEDNSFGTHEFLNLCEMLGCEPYISGNVGSGSVEEMAKWVEYMTSEQGSPMAKLRKENGREKPWKVKYFGVGNESWGCGGSMRPEYYSDLYRRYSTYCRNYNGNVLFKIASGASDYDYDWTETLMKNIGHRMDGVSLHYYTVTGWEGSKGSATEFTNDDYYWTMGKCLEIEDVLKRHIAIMDKYDPKKQIALMVDEWGTWWDQEPGSIPGHLYQQNTMRDAFVASLSLDVFHKYTDRVKMTNIAQIANVLQSMILTKDDKMVLTPTYHVFEMYNVHQDATYLPLNLECSYKVVRDNREVPMVSATASRKDGLTHISLSNVSLDEEQEITIKLDGETIKSVSGRILTSEKIDDYNTFEKPNVVCPKEFKGVKISKNVLTVKLPAMSIVTLELK